MVYVQVVKHMSLHSSGDPTFTKKTSRETSYIERIDQLLGKGRLVHGYLFAGPVGSPKEKAARYMAQRVLVDNDVENNHTLWHHPDLIWVDPPDTSHKVDDTRQWMQALLLAPVKNKRRLLIINGAERLTREAQNSFLKFLEEPPPGRIILLLSEEPWKLLPTVRSRLLTIFFGQKDWKDIKQKLLAAGVRDEEAATLAPFYADVHQALMVAEHASFRTLRESVVQWVCALSERSGRKRDAGGVMIHSWLTQPLVKEKPELLFQLVLAALKDMLRLARVDNLASTHKEELYYPDYVKDLHRAAHTLGLASIGAMTYALLMGWEAYQRAHTLFPIERVLWNLGHEERLTWASML